VERDVWKMHQEIIKIVEEENKELREKIMEKKKYEKTVEKELEKGYEDPPLSPKCCRLVPTEQSVGVKQSHSNVY